MSRPPFCVAELSGNHRGQLSYALDLVEAAAAAGADAVKVQTFTPSQMADPGNVIEIGPWVGRDLLELYAETHTPRDWHKPIFDHARKLGMIPFASAFHPDDIEFLQTLDCPIYKIASFEINDLELIKKAASTGKPLIISTGMATSDEITIACVVAADAGCVDLTLLKCTSAYPAPIEELNLMTILDMCHFPGRPAVGLSDHTLGSNAAIVATALGAKVIEKHLTLSRRHGGADASFSAEPDEFRAMVDACEAAALAYGTISYGPTPSEQPQVALRRKSGQKRGFI